MVSEKLLEVKKDVITIDKDESKFLQNEIEIKMGVLEKEFKELNQIILEIYDVLNFNIIYYNIILFKTILDVIFLW